MCGKFTQLLAWREARAFSEFLPIAGGPQEAVTPMRFAHVIRLDERGERETARMRWGFSSLHAKEPTGKPDHIHARAETIDSKPTFRDAFARARGILPVRSFNEGREITPSKTEQHTITPRDGKPLGIAVLWESWTHPSEGELLTFVMVTTAANTLIGTITDRMPAVIAPEHWGKWLGEEAATPAELKALLQPFEDDWEMEAESKPPKWKPKKPDGQGDLF
ncbi:MAG TPA: SOS response-associated peptidase [Rhizomicrobium sp.]|jgi:putative SOS response-associated peptidase YedK|nr:SOS response-associated peptidase [Rhizomicrobium sp.]